MNRKIYTLGLYLIFPIILIYFFYRGLKDRRYYKHFLERLGFIKPIPQFVHPANGKKILIHCASVGETKAATPLIEALFHDNRFSQIVITNTTPTGRAETEKLINTLHSSNKSLPHISNYYLPIDWPFSCKQFLEQLTPHFVTLMETELWPNFIAQCNQNEIPIVLANARLSNKSSRSYQRYPRLTTDIFSGITYIAAQYESDKAEFLRLNIPPEKIKKVGSIKFDIKINDALKTEQDILKLKWLNDRPCWIACSIHPGEFLTILNTHKKLLESHANLLLVAVPRHPEQFSKLKTMASNMNLNFVSRSEHKTPEANTQLVIGDTMGELLLLCGVADMAFVGGSMIDRGGHNPLEPAACGLPVTMGKSVYNFSDVSKIMLDYGVLNIIQDESELTTQLGLLLNESNRQSNFKNKTKHLFEENGQSVSRLCEIIYSNMK